MRKKNKRKQQKSTVSDNSCLTDSCFYISFDGCFDFDGGCLDSGDGGCLEFDGGCFDIGGGCALVMLLPLRILVIAGLMLYGDWDYAKWQAKIPG